MGRIGDFFFAIGSVGDTPRVQVPIEKCMECAPKVTPSLVKVCDAHLKAYRNSSIGTGGFMLIMGLTMVTLCTLPIWIRWEPKFPWRQSDKKNN